MLPSNRREMRQGRTFSGGGRTDFVEVQNFVRLGCAKTHTQSKDARQQASVYLRILLIAAPTHGGVWKPRPAPLAEKKGRLRGMTRSYAQDRGIRAVFRGAKITSPRRCKLTGQVRGRLHGCRDYTKPPRVQAYRAGQLPPLAGSCRPTAGSS